MFRRKRYTVAQVVAGFNEMIADLRDIESRSRAHMAFLEQQVEAIREAHATYATEAAAANAQAARIADIIVPAGAAHEQARGR